MFSDEKSPDIQKEQRLPDTPVPIPAAKSSFNIFVSKHTIFTNKYIPEQAPATYVFPSVKKNVFDHLVTQPTQPAVAAPRDGYNSRLVEGPTTPLPAVFEFMDENDARALRLQTVSLRAINNVQAKKKVTTFFTVVAGWFGSIVFLSGLLVLCLLLSDPIYKVEALLIFLIALSYIASAQMKLLDRLRPKTKPFLSINQLVPPAKKDSSAHINKDMGHFKLIKEDTITYLRVITEQNLKKDKQQ